jgi:hypothetical protein
MYEKPYERGDVVVVQEPGIRPWSGWVMACKPVRRDKELFWYISVGQVHAGATYEVVVPEAWVVRAEDYLEEVST